MRNNKSSFKKKYRFTPKFKALLCRFVTIVLSAILILAAHSYYSSKLALFDIADAIAVKAKIVQLDDLVHDSADMGGGAEYQSTSQYFHAIILTGEFKGETIYAVQTLDNLGQGEEDPVEVGDKVILYNYGMEIDGASFVFGGYSRLNAIIVLGVIYCVLLLVFGRFKGLNTILSLGFTCLAVFCVFLPAVMSGTNIYGITIAVCIFIIAMTLLITEGPTYKSFTTIIGCSFGVLVAAVLEISLDKIMRLTGVIDEHSIYLTYFDPPLNLNALIFAMVVIGAMGAVMDVAMDISSSLHELHVKAPALRFNELFDSGLTIGRDVMGTMANTLVLAYIGSSLCSIILMLSYSSSLIELLNRESIIVELMNGLIGSMAILLTIPLTSLVCAVTYTKNRVQVL